MANVVAVIWDFDKTLIDGYMQPPLFKDYNVDEKLIWKQHKEQHELINIADRPSDIPAFSVINRFGGATFAVYPKENQAAFDQVEQLREDGRIDMYAEANFSKGTTVYMWITHKIKKLADRMYDMEKSKIN